MSVTSGFFNSLNHDRRYSAQQMSAIFDGIINDGVFANIGVAFKVNADSGVTINIGEGKAWFTSAWVYNDALLPITLEGSEVVLDRIDAVVIDVDHNDNVRLGSIKVVKGTPSSSPKRPTLASDKKHSQHPLAYIYRKASSTAITQADITNMVGTSSCPYITGILQVQNIDNIVAQWNAQWNQWYAEKVAETDTDASELLAEMKSEFDIWFNDFKSVLDDDIATHLAAQVADLMSKFDTLAKEGAVYDEIEDSDLDEIFGSDGTPIRGKTVFSSDSTAAMPTPHDIGAVATDGTTPMAGHLDMNKYCVRNVAEPEEDGDGANAGYVKKIASKTSHPRNLLDNSDFRNPVNQRGQSSYTSYFATAFDRWIISSNSQDSSVTATVSQVSDGLQFRSDSNGRILWGQRLPAKALSKNKSYTAVACKSDGTIIWGVVGDFVDEYGFWSINFRIADNDTLVWAALYEGEYTAETLPEYQPKGYGAELAECKRYFITFRDNVYRCALQSEGGYHVINVYFPVTMRAIPTIGYNFINGSADGIIAETAYMDGITLLASKLTIINYLTCSADL